MAEVRRCRRGLAGALLALLAGGCDLAPHYRVPATPTPTAYKETGPAAGPWATATPLDTDRRGRWWERFGDPDLDALEDRIERDNPTLAAALARHDEATAVVTQARADLFPQASVSADASRNRLAGSRPLGGQPYLYSLYTVGGSVSYEVDLWGRVRNNVRAYRGTADATLADSEDTRLALQAELADAYFRLRGLDTQLDLLRQTVAAFARAYGLADTRHQGGVASGLDVSRAQTVLSDARAQTSANAAARAAVEHSIAALVGVPASAFAIPYARSQIAPPPIPAGAPSLLLQRRPDIAAAERRVYAANARIGVARAAYFPSLTLGGSGGLETTGAGSLLSSPAAFWALGPAAAALTVLDIGRRAGQVRQARAVQREQAANYRATVLAAFQQVEDQLAAQRLLAQQEVDERDAARAAAKTEELALTRYRDGASDYLDVVTAQTAALTSESAAIAVRTQRLEAAVALVRALGGGLPPAAG